MAHSSNHAFVGVRTRGGISGQRSVFSQMFGVDWQKLVDLRHTYSETIKAEIENDLDKMCAKNHLRVNHSSIVSGQHTFVIVPTQKTPSIDQPRQLKPHPSSMEKKESISPKPNNRSSLAIKEVEIQLERTSIDEVKDTNTNNMSSDNVIAKQTHQSKIKEKKPQALKDTNHETTRVLRKRRIVSSISLEDKSSTKCDRERTRVIKKLHTPPPQDNLDNIQNIPLNDNQFDSSHHQPEVDTVQPTSSSTEYMTCSSGHVSPQSQLQLSSDQPLSQPSSQEYLTPPVEISPVINKIDQQTSQIQNTTFEFSSTSPLNETKTVLNHSTSPQSQNINDDTTLISKTAVVLSHNTPPLNQTTNYVTPSLNQTTNYVTPPLNQTTDYGTPPLNPTTDLVIPPLNQSVTPLNQNQGSPQTPSTQQYQSPLMLQPSLDSTYVVTTSPKPTHVDIKQNNDEDMETELETRKAGKRLRTSSMESGSELQAPTQSPKITYNDDDSSDNKSLSNAVTDTNTKISMWKDLMNLKMTKVPNISATKSFLPPRNSPVKAAENMELRQKILKTKINEKSEKEEARKRELELKREKERQERIRRREEKIRKVAENKAALQKKAIEKKMRIEAQKEKPDEAYTIKKKETEEKGQKLKQRHLAAEQRRKEKEKENKQKLQTIEEERRLQEELHRKRLELKDEERQRKQQEKAEQLKMVIESHNAAIQKDNPVIATTTISEPPIKPKQQVSSSGLLLDIPISQVPSSVVTDLPKSQVSTTIISEPPKPQGPSLATSSASSILPAPILESKPQGSSIDNPPVKATPISKYANIASYQITPVSKDPLIVADNYDITELDSGDSSDDEDCPKKTVPMWAAPSNLHRIMAEQECLATQRTVERIFPPEELLLTPDLSKIFHRAKKRFFKRTSSAQWTSPILKKSRPVNNKL